jgi:hypothetical protein
MKLINNPQDYKAIHEKTSMKKFKPWKDFYEKTGSQEYY